MDAFHEALVASTNLSNQVVLCQQHLWPPVEIRRATGPRRVRSSKCWSVVILVLLILSPRGARDRVSAGVAHPSLDVADPGALEVREVQVT